MAILVVSPLGGCLGVDNMDVLKDRLGYGEKPPVVLPPEGHIGSSRPVALGTLDVVVGEVITLFATGYSDPQNLKLAFTWEIEGFGDRTGETVDVSWGMAGTFVVTLTVKNSAGLAAADSVTVVVTDVPGNTQPTSRFTVRNAAGAPVTSGNVSENLTFDPSASSDPEDGAPTGFEWDFGDATPLVSTPRPTRAFVAAGLYEVSLRVVDSRGLNDTSRRLIAIDFFERLHDELSATRKTADHNFSVSRKAQNVTVSVEFDAGTGAGLNDLDIRLYDAAGNETGSATAATQPSDAGTLKESVSVSTPALAATTEGTWRLAVELKSGLVVAYDATIYVSY
ncbi:MAG: PKD domain-containing protein [Euryarchaeota archaeon]|nr:PKD domain-containing protein [Euryarchaeota archaeon]